MTERVLYLPSTPFNLLVSLLDARQRGVERAQLIMIDQRQPVDYLDLLENNSDFPFERVTTLPAAQGMLKPIVRRQHFAQLWSWVAPFKPTEILVGSDRRVEFQFLMHRCQQAGHPAKGIYLDDGLYTYMTWPKGRVARFLDNLAKQLAYGFWWQAPQQVGDSSWIQQAHVFAPEVVLPSLKTRPLMRLDGRYLLDPSLRRHAAQITQRMGVEVGRLSLPNVKIILTPHPADIKNTPSFEQAVRQEIESAQGPVFVKYHPRFDEHDALGLAAENVSILPKNMAFEFLLPMLDKSAEVVGDLTTAVLSTRWMRPEIKARAIGRLSDRVDARLLSLYEQFDVEINHAGMGQG